ncbi:hypothetical protein G6L37_04915 [Agrobacterium rubi]|nr:hypothetical protein [Agrobacterium rubi]NTF24696.1 hypothetical protein [Agrobacterium rubi]
MSRNFNTPSPEVARSQLDKWFAEELARSTSGALRHSVILADTLDFDADATPEQGAGDLQSPGDEQAARPAEVSQ